jgi:putative ABC transport system permease protein
LISAKVIFKEILSQKLRLFLAILSIAWGTASIACLLSIGEGLRVSFMKKSSSGGNLTLAVQPFYTTKNFQGLPKGTKVRFTGDNAKSFLQLSGVKDIAMEKSFSALARNGKNIAYSSSAAVTPNYQLISSIQVQPGGRFINGLDMRESEKVAFIGEKVASSLFPKRENPVNMIFSLGNTQFKVIGVSKPAMGFGSYGSSVSNRIVIPRATYQVLTGDNDITQIVLLLEKGTDLESIKTQIINIVAKDQGFSSKDKGAISFSDSGGSAKKLDTFLMGFQLFLGIIGGATLLVSGVGIANIMYMSITRATRTIGTQMAIGATYANILMHYFIESMLITLTGGIIGILATVGLVELTDKIPIHNQTFVQLGSPRPMLSWGVLLVVVGALGLIGFFAAYFPARNAALISPAAALREEG